MNCKCGSGKESTWQYDGRGIPLVRTCEDCYDEQMSKYRPEVLNYYTQADVDEQIEPDPDDMPEPDDNWNY